MADSPPTRAAQPHVVIVGGGFGGLYAARALRRAAVRVTLVDRRNHHLFQPLLYQVASAVLDPSDIAFPIRAAFRRQRNVHVVLDEARRVDLERGVLQLRADEIPYDFLILATGASASYFGHDEWSPYAPALKTIEDALEIRRRVLLAFEAAEHDPDGAAAWLTFVVVGGGPTGVEMAGAFLEIARNSLAHDFRNIDPRLARVLLIEAGDRVLGTYPEELSDKARAQLERLGVDVRTSTMVTEIDDAGVMAGDERIEARTVLWTAGVKASALGKSLGAPLDRAGRVEVREDLTIPGHDNVFVVGDLAAAHTGPEARPVPGVAPAAIQGGRHAARCIRRRLAGQGNVAFRYRDKGSLATIGRAAGVADFGRLRVSGFVAWVLWLTVHIFFLIGFRNRLFVLLSWAWSYFTFQRGARLITGVDKDLLPPT